jgi:PAS domain S-box-containing protein
VRLPKVQKPPNDKPLRVLIVEDSENDALLLLRELERGGYEPISDRVETPEMMLKALAGSEWDVIISDYSMPRFSAPEALKMVREAGLEAPIIVVSGKVGEEAAIETMKAGAHDFLTKDNLARLCPAVKRGLEKAEERWERKRAEQSLSESEERYHVITEAASDAIFLIDEDSHVLFATGAAEKIFGYSREEILGNKLTMLMPEHLRHVHEASLKRYLETGERRVVWNSVHLYGLHKSGWEIPLEVSFGEYTKQGRRFFTGFVRDVTERKKNEEELRESERLYRTVMEQAAENICLVDTETRRIVESNPAFRATLGYGEEELRNLTLYDIVAHDKESIDRNVRRVLEQGRRLVGSRKYRRKDGSLFDVEVSASTILRDGRETFCVVAHDVTERARIQEQLEERVDTLSRIASSIGLELSMEEMLYALAKSVVNASTAVACIVALSDERSGVLRPVGSYGLPEGFKAGLDAFWQAGAQSPTIEACRGRQPMLVHNIRRFLFSDALDSPRHHIVREAPWETTYIVPLLSRGSVLGAINFLYLPKQEPGEDEKVFLKAVTDQAAVALENARLFAEVRDKVALEERQRLARELHDSVSQALYSITLHAKTARMLLERDLKQAADSLEYVLSLAKAGQSEMRALIFELRPESLEEEGLVAALQKQADALEARYEIKVVATLCSEPEASLEVKEAVYRITQEALHNTVKHARASNVEIRMECTPDQLTLGITDDGVGFETRGDFPGHLGLRSMRERASRLGGTLEMDSGLGKGTRIRARVPVRQVDVPHA